ncbi:MAG: HTTM domain-containing protein [Bdellovibrionales bacterium]|nr:HTTM domain-containing protein [Bdellovibrionales bacterium]
MNLESVLRFTEFLLILSLLQKSIEFIWLETSRRRERAMPHFYDCFHIDNENEVHNLALWKRLIQKNYLSLLWVFVFLCILQIFVPSFILSFSLLIAYFLILQRWQGLFNGGSDYMTVVALVGVMIARWPSDDVIYEKVGLVYIAIQAVLSYFIAGWVKIRRKEWIDGKALRHFVSDSPFSVPKRLRDFVRHRPISLLLGWAVLFFELTFPLALISEPTLIGYVFFAIIFHLVIWWMFGLNRFVFSWMVTYPSLFYLSFLVRQV